MVFAWLNPWSDARTADGRNRSGLSGTDFSSWQQKWDGFLSAMKIGTHAPPRVGSTRHVCHLMLRLYAHKPVVRELEALYAHSPDLFLFYVPQLVNFALHGGAEPADLASLEGFLAAKCASSIRFAQRVWWFVAAFSPGELESSLIAKNAENLATKACEKLEELPEPKHLGVVDEQEITIDKPLARFAKGPPHVVGVSEFKWAVAFCEELTNMGVLLKDVPLAERLVKLRATLRQLEADYMPSKCLYLPVGGYPCRIVGIVGSESFCFKTNERVPFLICLELIDDDREGALELPEDHDVATPLTLNSPAAPRSEVPGNGKDEDARLGQWTPRVVQGLGKGAGFSHIGMHPDMDFEHEREHAKRLALAQFHSSVDQAENFVEVELHAAQSQPTFLRRNPHSLVRKSSTEGTDLYDIDIGLAANGAGDEAEENEGAGDEFFEGEAHRVIFRERWAAKEKRVASSSRWSNHKGWRLKPVIVKSGDDLRQEQFAAQLIALFHMIFKEEGLDLWLHSYEVLAVSPDSGIIECIPDTISLDSLKKNDPSYTNLKNFFLRYFGPTNSEGFVKARDNFAKSLAAYCIVCYLLQIKDRHNGNLLLDAEGHIVHIDFGFILGSLGPGGMNFEGEVPFKLTNEFMQVLGGPESATFRHFRTLCCKGYLAARKHREQFILMIEMMLNKSTLPCFQAGGDATIKALNQRFCVDKSRTGCISFVNDLIDTSINHWRQRYYDVYQSCCVGIAV